MKDLIRKILFEETQKNEVFIDENIKKFLFSYWEKNGTELTPLRYLGFSDRDYSVDVEIDKLKVEFYGGYFNALESAKKELGMDQKIHISDGEYEFDITVKSIGFFKANITRHESAALGAHVRITDGSVEFLNGDPVYRWDFDELFHGGNEIDEDTLYEVTMEISGAIREYLNDIFDKYGLTVETLYHNYRDAWRK